VTHTPSTCVEVADVAANKNSIFRAQRKRKSLSFLVAVAILVA
jgi:hypothetical protein